MSPAQRIEEQAAEWIAIRDGDQWNERLQRQLDAWLAESALHRVTYLRLDSVWKRADRLQALHEAPVRPAVPRPRSRPWRAWLMQMQPRAAIASVAVAAAVITASSWAPGDRQTTQLGERKTIALPDGSRLTLNTATRMRTSMDGGHRRAWLDQGEAYFDVAHDPKHPFEVWAGPQRVVVLGTRFTVRRAGDRVQVAVLEGRVQVLSETAAPLTLLPGQTATALGAAPTVTTQTPRQAAIALGWLEGTLVFDRISLADAAAQFNRYNRKQLVMGNSKAAQLLIGGTFGATNVDAFARLLHSSFGLDVVERGDTIVVRSPEN